MKENILVLSVGLIFAPIHSMNNQQLVNYDPGQESLGAITDSTQLPLLSPTFCEHILKCAPKDLQDDAKLLINPITRAKILPEKIVLHGPAGTGKTTLGRVILQKIGAPFIILKAAQLGTEYDNSRSSGIRRVGALLTKIQGNLLIDEIDCLAVPKNQNSGTERESTDDTPKALWQLIDDMENNKLLLIGTSNCLENMPAPLQSRLRGCLYEIPITKVENIQKSVVLHYFQGKHVLYLDKIIDQFCKNSRGLSNRDLARSIHIAYKASLKRDAVNPIITFDDLNAALKKVKSDAEFYNRKRWKKREIFNYTVQTIGAIANLVSIVNTVISLRNNYRSLEIAQAGLSNQNSGLQMQEQSLNYQGHGLQLQEQGISMQEEALQMQHQSLEYQGQGLQLQERGVELQEQGLTMQERSLIYQQEGLGMQRDALKMQERMNRYQIWGSAWAPFAVLGKGWDATKWTGKKIIYGFQWAYNKL